MKRARDSQRSKLYKSENCFRINPEPTLSLVDCQRLADRVVAWSQEYTPPIKGGPHYPYHCGRPDRVTVRDGRGRRSANANATTLTIKLPRWARQRWVVLHEMAHILQTEDPAHGRQFAAIFLDLVRHFMGREAEQMLRLSYRSHRVKWCAKRPKREV